MLYTKPKYDPDNDCLQLQGNVGAQMTKGGVRRPQVVLDDLNRLASQAIIAALHGRLPTLTLPYRLSVFLLCAGKSRKQGVRTASAKREFWLAKRDSRLGYLPDSGGLP